MMNIRMYGDQALLVNFDQQIDEEVNQQVIALNQAITDQMLPGFRYSIPAYCSLTIAYDPFQTNFETLKEEIEGIAESISMQDFTPKTRKLRIPVCYEEGFALDFEELMNQVSLSRAEIISLHTSIPFRVFMLGFMPGFTYMGKLPQSLYCTRKQNPRLRVPRGSVGLAGFQTGIYPSELPGGWQIIGRTPLSLFDPHLEQPFLFQAGDEVNFEAISEAAFQDLAQQVEQGTFEIQQILNVC